MTSANLAFPIPHPPRSNHPTRDEGASVRRPIPTRPGHRRTGSALASRYRRATRPEPPSGTPAARGDVSSGAARPSPEHEHHTTTIPAPVRVDDRLPRWLHRGTRAGARLVRGRRPAVRAILPTRWSIRSGWRCTAGALRADAELLARRRAEPALAGRSGLRPQDERAAQDRAFAHPRARGVEQHPHPARRRGRDAHRAQAASRASRSSPGRGRGWCRRWPGWGWSTSTG